MSPYVAAFAFAFSLFMAGYHAGQGEFGLMGIWFICVVVLIYLSGRE